MRLEEIVHATVRAKDDKEQKIFNNAGQVWNHDFYLAQLRPETHSTRGKTRQAIERDFGGHAELMKIPADDGVAQFGSSGVC